MSGTIFFTLSALIVIASAVLAAFLSKNNEYGRKIKPFHALCIGVFLALFIGMIPGFENMVGSDSEDILTMILLNIKQCIQVFTADAGAEFILDNINQDGISNSVIYSAYLACLFLAAPLLTFGFIISLFRNAAAWLRYLFSWRKDAYVFSELNEKSLQLARSLRSNHPNAALVFTGVSDEEDGAAEQLDEAHDLKAIVFGKDILSVSFARHSGKHSIVFFVIGEDESRNVMQALKLIAAYREREKTDLFVLSTETEGELLLSNADAGKLRLRRVDEVRALVYQTLWQDGEELFRTAKQVSGSEKAITIVIAGLGRYGTELLKALTWYCQMTGYSVTIHAFDADERAEDLLTAKCPELLSEAYNGVRIPGESAYTIRIHSGTDVRTGTFARELAAIPDITCVFVCLGSDRENINQAAALRMLCERAGSRPIIKAVVSSSEAAEVLKGITNFRGQAYAIDTIGNVESTCSEETLMGSELEREALQRHLKWGSEDEFWRYEYNYRSSMASAVHRKARIACGIPGAGKPESEITDAERDGIEQLEHRRWNAYMRSEGYVYSGSPDKSSRNDLAKMHHDLVDFSSLSEEDKRKDSRVGLK